MMAKGFFAMVNKLLALKIVCFANLLKLSHYLKCLFIEKNVLKLAV
jgi:hypothetical protein